jgi:hypothetical protein
MSTIRRSTAERIRDFYQAGGTVIALHRLPLISVEAGRDDILLKSVWDSMFDREPTAAAFTERANAQGGRAYLVSGSVEDVLSLLPRVVERDVEVVSAPADHIDVLHKQKDGLDFYWVVNDSPSPRTSLLRLRATGRPERWDAVTGKRLPVFYQTVGKHTLVRLALGVWDAAYLVFDPSGAEQPFELEATNLDDFHMVQVEPDQVIVQGRQLVTAQTAFVELSQDGRIYRGEYKPSPAAPLEITGAWNVTVDAPVIPQPYAQVRDDPQDRGKTERWFADYTPGDWAQVWLSPMNCSIRGWNVIGPFPNPGDRGLDRRFPPESEIDYQAAYPLSDGRQLSWLRCDAAREVLEHPPGGLVLGTVLGGGGRYGRDSNLVDYGQALRMSPPLAGVIFAQTNLYVSEPQDAVVVLSTANPAAAWVNGQQIYSRWLRPLYHELTDAFAFRIPVRLEKGWNSLLLKFVHDPVSLNARPGVFTCRLDSPDQRVLRNLVAGTRPIPEGRLRGAPGFRWLRLPAPAVAAELRVADLRAPWLAFVDGKPVPAAREVELPPGTRVVTLRVAASEILDQPFEFTPRRVSLPLGTWTVPGFEHFSGSLTYEKTVDVPAALLQERLLLDCGEVGVVAEAWINGAYAGARPWQPFVFDAGEHLRPGANHLKVRVANSDGNARARGAALDNLKNIDRNGWLGPARLVPYFEREIRCPGKRM